VDDALAERYRRIIGEIDGAARAAGRDPAEITTIVVTKFHPASLVRDLYDLGARNVGESRHQEAGPKAASLQDLSDLTWHFVGQLQSNKALAVSAYASVIHSVDRPSVVNKLAQADHDLDVFIELNLTDDPGRGGVTEADLPGLVESVLAATPLRLRGVMAVAPQEQDPARAFGRVRDIQQVLLRLAPDATDLSMGMSGDFVEAIHAGATHLRIGTAITGKRPYPA
jgi:pyridoxal phosphate enzyme (YggS family)